MFKQVNDIYEIRRTWLEIGLIELNVTNYLRVCMLVV